MGYKFIQDKVPICEQSDDSSRVCGYGQLHQQVESIEIMLDRRNLYSSGGGRRGAEAQRARWWSVPRPAATSVPAAHRSPS